MARLENANGPIRRQGAVRLPIAKQLACSELEPSDVVGSMELTQIDADAIAETLSKGLTVKLIGVVGINGKSRELHHVAFVNEPAPVATEKLPIELSVKFEKTPEELRDLVLDELIKYKRSISDGVERVKLNVSQLIALVEGAVQENLHLCNSCGGDHRVDRDAAYQESLRILNLLKDAQGSVCAPAPLTSVTLIEIVERERNDASAAMHNRPGSHEMAAAYLALDRLLMKLRAATKF